LHGTCTKEGKSINILRRYVLVNIGNAMSLTTSLCVLSTLYSLP
jgi:hypothetical protein